MIELVNVNDLHVELIDSWDLETLWDGYTTYEKLRESFIKCRERNWNEVDFEVFPAVNDEELCCKVYIMLSSWTIKTVKDLLPEIVEGL